MRYKETNQDWHISQLGALMGEGTGFLGTGTSYSFRGAMVVRGNILFLSATASCAMMAAPLGLRPGISFLLKASLSQLHKHLETKTFAKESEFLIPTAWDQGIFQYIGSVEFNLPEPEIPVPLTVRLEGYCVLDTGAGHMFPGPSMARGEYQIKVEDI